MSVAENIFIGNWPKKGILIDIKKMYQYADMVINQLGFALNSRITVSLLSAAECQMVEISRAIARSARLIILDEPTSSLSYNEVHQLFNAIRKLSESGVGILYVSHRMNEIREIAKTATIMRDGEIIDNVSLKDTDNNQIIRMMLGIENNRETDNVCSGKNYQKEIILSLRRVSQPPKIKNISFDLHRGEILGIAGLLGTGRTELLNLIAGLDKVYSGEIIYKDLTINKWCYRSRVKNGIAITPEDRKNNGIFPLLGIDENTVISNWNKVSKFKILSKRSINRETGKIINSISVKTKSTKELICNLSGGNQQKIVIGRWIYAGSKMLLLDEPTRGIDVESKYQIYALCRHLAARGISIIFISSEIEELPLICERILVLRGEKFMKSSNILI